MNTLVLKFDAAGAGHCLYSELIDLTVLGPLAVHRASRRPHPGQFGVGVVEAAVTHVQEAVALGAGGLDHVHDVKLDQGDVPMAADTLHEQAGLAAGALLGLQEGVGGGVGGVINLLLRS